MASDESGGEQPIIIKKINKGGGHHGGAWKVAYADFVTAMMAFFLLMWLLNATSQDQKDAISNYFDPAVSKVSDSTSGAGGVMGGTSLSVEGAKISDNQPIMQPASSGSQGNPMNAAHATGGGQSVGDGDAGQGQQAVEQAAEEIREEEEDKLEQVKNAIEKALEENPDLKEVADNLIVDMTAEGLRIQVIDKQGSAMFPSGSARMYEKTKTLLDQVADIIKGVDNDISIRGHTDSIPYGSGSEYTNWDLSTDRANASRRALEAGGIPGDRIHNVVGKADTEHFLPDDPTNAQNRRISITLLREEITDPDAAKKKAENRAKEKSSQQKQSGTANQPPPLPSANNLPKATTGGTYNNAPLPTPETQDFQRTEGNVVFP